MKRDKRYWIVFSKVRKKYPNMSKQSCGIRTVYALKKR